MARSFGDFGNALYTGETSISFISKRRVWYLISAILIIVSIVGPILRGGFTFGIEFSGGSNFQIHTASSQTRGEQPAIDTVNKMMPNSAPRVTLVGQTDVQVQTEQLKSDQSNELRERLADAYDVDDSEVTASYIGAVWGQDVTRQAVIALLVFILFASLVMAIYFRTWKMSLAAVTALGHDLVITAGIYGISGFEITPAAMIGFLTILGYSLYDTVVVFDKIRENTTPEEMGTKRTFAEAVNLAVNQTLVRSINTSVVALLPVASILFIGAFVLGAGTLRDIALALFIGILVGAYSTIFIAAPVYAHLREKDPKMREHDRKVRAGRSAQSDGSEEQTDADTTEDAVADTAGSSRAQE
jgi:preprotein translocase subunit SecF